MSIRKKKNKGGVVYEVSPYDPTTGKRVRRRFKKRIEAETFLYNLSQGIGLTEEEKQDITFETESNLWLNFGKNNHSTGHYRRSKKVIEEFGDRFRHIDPNQLKAKTLFDLQTHLKGKGLANSSVNRVTEVFTTMMNFSLAQGRIQDKAFKGFKKLHVPKSEMLFWSREDASSFLKFAEAKYKKHSKDRWKYVVYLIALNTGARGGEIWGLQKRDLLFESGFIHIRRQVNKVTLELKETKGKVDRKVPMNDILKRHLGYHVGDPDMTSTKLVFTNKVGKPISHDNFYRRIFLKDLREWGGPNIRFHDMRHTAITLMVASGQDIKVVQYVAGHKDIKTTMNYVHVLGQSLEQARGFSIY